MKSNPINESIPCMHALCIVDGKREDIEGYSSKVNKKEADRVVDLCCFLLGKAYKERYDPLPSHIIRRQEEEFLGIISPLRMQCEYIKDELESRGINIDPSKDHFVKVDTAEAWQGDERDITIISPALDSESTGAGYYSDSKRFNVMTSRARLFTYLVFSPFRSASFNLMNAYRGRFP